MFICNIITLDLLNNVIKYVMKNKTIDILSSYHYYYFLLLMLCKISVKTANIAKLIFCKNKKTIHIFVYHIHLQGYVRSHKIMLLYT